jgi:hypothetical protein
MIPYRVDQSAASAKRQGFRIHCYKPIYVIHCEIADTRGLNQILQRRTEMISDRNDNIFEVRRIPCPIDVPKPYSIKGVTHFESVGLL